MGPGPCPSCAPRTALGPLPAPSPRPRPPARSLKPQREMENSLYPLRGIKGENPSTDKCIYSRSEVHKETIDAVPNAIPGRTDIELEIYGMEGIPEKDMEERRRLLEQKTQARKRNNRMILMSMKMMNLQLQLHFNPSKFSRSRGTFPQWHSQVCLLCQVHQGCLQYTAINGRCSTYDAWNASSYAWNATWDDANGWNDASWARNPTSYAWYATRPPPVGPRPGMPPMTQAQPVTAPGILNRPPAPAAAAPTPQPPVTKPLFPSAGQMGTPVTSSSAASSNSESLSASSNALFPSTAQAAAAVPGPVGTDFKPLNSTPATTTEPPKPTFPAYTQSTASTTSTTNSTAAKPATSITSKPATLTTTSATSKLIHPDEDISLEERRAQLPKYQRNLPRPGQAALGNPPVGPIGGMMPPQPGIPPQQQGMRPPMPPHGQYGAHHQGMPGYLPGAMPPYGQGPPMVPPYQSGPPRPPMGMRPPVMSQGGRY
uniref:Zinc finger protein 207 n=1 Tax=Taeniopygia guttata TaxID=59729 RepID=A0A674HVY4_TAEGU